MSIAVIASESQRQGLLPAIRCAAAGHQVVSTETASGIDWETILFVVVDEDRANSVLQAVQESKSRAKVLLIGPYVSHNLVKLALNYSRVVGISCAASGVPDSWEISYITRRVLAPTEATPMVSQFLGWGVTNVVWTPRSTSDLRRVVKQIEDISKNLGADRRESTLAANAAHEMLMNALYDAPVNEVGQPLYAFDRKSEISLVEHQRPTFRLAISAGYIGLDVTDPFGRLPRNRFFEGILRGQQSRGDTPVLDTSHGGAGLGLFTLHANGSVLRVELRPMKETHLSWMLRRGQPHRAREDRSLYFVALQESR